VGKEVVDREKRGRAENEKNGGKESCIEKKSTSKWRLKKEKLRSVRGEGTGGKGGGTSRQNKTQPGERGNKKKKKKSPYGGFKLQGGCNGPKRKERKKTEQIRKSLSLILLLRGNRPAKTLRRGSF